MSKSRVQAPKTVENREASMGDIPKQGSGPQRDLRDEATIARVLAIVMAECDRFRALSDEAKQSNKAQDMYRYNTALHALWDVAAKISGKEQAAEVAAEGQDKSRLRDLEHLSSDRRRGLEEAAKVLDERIIELLGQEADHRLHTHWQAAAVVREYVEELRRNAKAIRALISPSSEGGEEKT